ncbi:MAG TPA: NmrA family NAD(P)-binding protein [Candidatus Angelobacter sp.]|nr:NmrA family NAD(P)-binding protein [Candidatus Angelobacter sp.]
MYVVTGATGNTGSVVAKQLLAQGQKVRVIGRSADRLQPLVKTGAEPFVADITDAAALTKAFTGAQAVYVMIPPDMANPDFHSYQDHVTNAFAQALEKTGVKHAVVLSSIGADKAEKTGPVLGLHNLEQKLNQIAGLNVLHLRAGYFMENTLVQVGTVHAMGKAAGPVRPDLKLPMIAAQDIGAYAADALLKLDFSGKQTRELLGQRDLDYNEVTAIIGKAIHKPDLQYIQLPDEQIRPVLLQLGMSGNIADLLLEMSASLNSGYMKALEKRSPQNTTPTKYETFVTEEFVPLYQAKSKAA